MLQFLLINIDHIPSVSIFSPFCLSRSHHVVLREIRIDSVSGAREVRLKAL